jgi:hypothetical protein
MLQQRHHCPPQSSKKRSLEEVEEGIQERASSTFGVEMQNHTPLLYFFKIWITKASS